jgi:hypothetical protein
MDKARWKEEEACDVCVWKWNSWSEHIFDVGVKKRGGRSFRGCLVGRVKV